jgi:hypothetical protein
VPAEAPPDPAAVLAVDPPEPTPEALAARDPFGLAYSGLTRALRLYMGLATSRPLQLIGKV